MNMTGSMRLRFAGIAILAVVAAASLAACGAPGAPAAKSNADLLKEAAANMKAAKSYHMEADLTSAGQQVTMNGDIDVAADNSKLALSMGPVKMDLVKVNGEFYTSLDGGKTYTKGEPGSAPDMTALTGMWSSIKPEDIDKSKDALKDGTPATETIDGVETKHMTGNNKDLSALSGGTATGGDGTVDIWVTTGDKPTVRQMKIQSTETNGTLKWTKIDEPVTITAPTSGLGPDTTAGK